MAERKVDWGRQASYGRLQAKIGTCIIVDLQLKGQRVITCTKSYGKSIYKLKILRLTS